MCVSMNQRAWRSIDDTAGVGILDPQSRWVLPLGPVGTLDPMGTPRRATSTHIHTHTWDFWNKRSAGTDFALIASQDWHSENPTAEFAWKVHPGLPGLTVRGRDFANQPCWAGRSSNYLTYIKVTVLASVMESGHLLSIRASHLVDIGIVVQEDLDDLQEPAVAGLMEGRPIWAKKTN